MSVWPQTGKRSKPQFVVLLTQSDIQNGIVVSGPWIELTRAEAFAVKMRGRGYGATVQPIQAATANRVDEVFLTRERERRRKREG